MIHIRISSLIFGVDIFTCGTGGRRRRRRSFEECFIFRARLFRAMKLSWDRWHRWLWCHRVRSRRGVEPAVVLMLSVFEAIDNLQIWLLLVLEMSHDTSFALFSRTLSIHLLLFLNLSMSHFYLYHSPSPSLSIYMYICDSVCVWGINFSYSVFSLLLLGNKYQSRKSLKLKSKSLQSW